MLLFLALPAPAEQSPVRAMYPSVQTMDTLHLAQSYAKAVIVDVRSTFEYETARINKALSLPFADGRLAPGLERQRSRESGAPIVFYGNGADDPRPFRAVLAAQAAGFTNTFAYDDGVFLWLRAQPDRAELQGRTPADPSRIPLTGNLDGRRLSFEQFRKLATLPAALVVDVRGELGRRELPRLPAVRHVPMEHFISAVISRIWTERSLLIFDTDDTQTAWLDLLLKSAGYMDYHFLKGGVQGLDPALTIPVRVHTDTVTMNQRRLQMLAGETEITTFDKTVLASVCGHISGESQALVETSLLLADLRCSEAELAASLARLERARLLLAGTMDNSLLIKVNPRLAWKGPMEGARWGDRVREFDAIVEAE